MYQVQDGYSQYKEIDLAARTAAASPLELVLVLFSGLMDELERAKSHIEGRRFEKKAQSINKCIDILNALTSSLELKWFTEFGHLNRGDMLTSEQHRCHNEKKKFQRRV